MSYKFGIGIFNTLEQMLDEVASEYLTAGGSNQRDFVRQCLAKQSDEELAQEVISEWELDEAGDDREESHMDSEGYDKGELAEAFGRLREKYGEAE
jgi:hypothetical protein